MADSTLIWAANRPTDAGVIYRAPLGTTLPTNATTALNAAFVDHGWISDDGITLTTNRDTKKHHSFGGDVVKVTQDSFEESLKFNLLESSMDVAETVWGDDNVTGTDAAFIIKHGQAQLPRSAWVVEMIDGDLVRRLVVQEGQLTALDDVKYVHTGLVMYGVTVDCFKPSTGNTEAVYEYVADTGGS